MNLNDTLKDFVMFISEYNTQYGSIEVFETPKNFVIECYNGGWSENEALESEMSAKYRSLLVYDYHPIHIFVIPKLSPLWLISPTSFSVAGKVNIKEIKKALAVLTPFAKKRERYNYKMEIV